MQDLGSEQQVGSKRLRRVLVANRGEIAIRVARALADLEIPSVAVFSEDDSNCLHVLKADAAVPLRGTGPAAYLDMQQLIEVARAQGCDAIHPGYGFLSENADFARACRAAGVRFIGPDADTLEQLGDKVRARALAAEAGIPVLEGSGQLASADQALAFFDALARAGGSSNRAGDSADAARDSAPATGHSTHAMGRSSDREGARVGMVIKAVAGGGGRGMRVVRHRDEVVDAFARCASEAEAAFGSRELYAERWLECARHVEIQVAGDAAGQRTHLFERECSLQRRHQKLIEVAPVFGLPEPLRRELRAAALLLAKAADYRNLGTFEFLIDAADETPSRFYFIEANPRLQVEHTVTEEVTGVDLVQLQLELEMGAALSDLGLLELPEPTGIAIQARVNMERFEADGSSLPSGGTLVAFEPPAGPGIRVDSYGYVGYTTNPRFDSLLAKVIVHARRSPASPISSSSSPARSAARLAAHALRDFRIEGVDTNLELLCSLLLRPEFSEARVHTRFVESYAAELCRTDDAGPKRYFERGAGDALASESSPADAGPASAPPPGCARIETPLQGTLIELWPEVGQVLAAGEQIGVLEAMKMEHVLTATQGGTVRALYARAGDTLLQGSPVLDLEPGGGEQLQPSSEGEADLDAIRPDLAEVFERHAVGSDARRSREVEKRRTLGFRTARENLDDLVDPGSFMEYGSMVIAAQRRRRPVEELIERTPADGLIAGLARINGAHFGPEASRCMVLSYDYMVLAGTQGIQNHRKKDRMFELAESWRLPVVLFSEGGGGRPGDSDGLGVTGLDTIAFALFGRLSGWVPLVGIVNGRCFAGNAALLGCCDVVIATRRSNIGMGGPAMIEGGGLGVYRPEQIGPVEDQTRSGVIDVLVEDEAEAVAVAKRYLGYFQGKLEAFEAADQRRLRAVIPENRLRVYDVRNVIELLADIDSVLELRRDFGLCMVTALIRIEGRPIGVIANNPMHLAGAIDSQAADKAARFMQLCDAFDLPILFLCDTPGIMVGPEAERTGLVRHAARLFVTAGSLRVPFFSIVLRKGYGLGAQAMAGGSFKTPIFMVSWPTGEFGGMGLEGAVRLGFRRELDAIEDPEQRQRAFESMVKAAYERGKAVNVASHFELDAVIDPMESRRWIVQGLDSVPAPEPRTRKKRPCVDPW